MFKVLTLNVNGIRSAARKGLFTWLAEQQDLDVICFQEIKANLEQVQIPELILPGYTSYFFPAQKPGYSGVAIYTKHTPERVTTGLGFADADTEGRYLQVDFANISVASLYLPSGSSGEARQATKFRFMEAFSPILKEWQNSKKSFILCGDWNIAHRAIDLKNWRGNQKNSGFLPEERAWLDHLFDTEGWIDAFRSINPDPDHYTWWSNRGQAYAKNVGWRIDYQILSPDLKNTVKSVHIYREPRFSDHAPLVIEYTGTL